MTRVNLAILIAIFCLLTAFTTGPSCVGGSLLRRVSEARAGQDGSATDSILRFWLTPQIVSNVKPIANTFYFWTTPQELDSVVEQKRLLRTSLPSDHLEGIYWDRLSSNENNEPISNHLRSGDRQRIRSAWPCYWSMLNESYDYPKSTQLVQVVLMDSSLIVKFNPDDKKHRWTIFDLRGNEISMETAMQRKRHIAAVFVSGYNKYSFPAPRPLVVKEYFRTFILCNEDMIKSWHHAVPGMQARIINDLNYLVLMTAYFGDGIHGQLQGKKGKSCRMSWVKPATEMRISELFFATQRMAGDSGPNATEDGMKAIVNLLRSRWPQQKNPVERFPGAK